MSARSLLSARRQCQNSTAAVAEQRGSSRGFGDLSVMGMQSWTLSVLFGPCHLKACSYMSLWRARLWSCIKRSSAASLRGGHAVLQGCSVLGGFDSFKIWTHLLLNSCVVHAMVWSLLKVELCVVSSPRKVSYFGKASQSRTHSPYLAARLTEHIRCLYRPGLKDANKPRYRLLRRK